MHIHAHKDAHTETHLAAVWLRGDSLIRQLNRKGFACPYEDVPAVQTQVPDIHAVHELQGTNQLAAQETEERVVENMYICTHARTNTHKHVHAHVQAHTCTHTRTHTRTHTHTHAHACTRTRTHTRTHSHIHKHTHTLTVVNMH